MDEVRVERSGRNDLFDLHDADPAAHGRGRIEVPRGLAEDAVAGFIGFPGFHDGQVGEDALFHDVGLAVEVLVLLALGDHGADAGLGIESGDARAAGAHAFGQGALRVELDLEFSAQVLPHEFVVLAHVGGHHLPDLVRVEQFAEAETVDTAIVRRDGEILHAAVDNGVNQQFRDAAEAKTASRDEHSVMEKAVEGLRCAAIDLLHRKSPCR